MQRRRKVHTYFQTLTAELRDAIFIAAPTLDIFDAEFIITRFADRLDDYDGPETKQTFRLGFRAWAVEWISKVAKLTVLAKQLIPALAKLAESSASLTHDDCQQVAQRLLYNLHRFPSHSNDQDHFTEWTAAWVQNEVRNMLLLAEWIKEHRLIVYHGIQSILRDCRDLADDGTVEELAADVWHWVSLHANELLEDGAPLHLRLRARAVDTAQGWKTQRIRGPRYEDADAFETTADPFHGRGRRVTCRVEY